VLLAASEAPSDLPGRTFAEPFVLLGVRAKTVTKAELVLALRRKTQTVEARQAVPGRGDFWSGEERRFRVGALARFNN
jgi:hypothetical protein